MSTAKHINSGVRGLLLVAGFALVVAGLVPRAQADPPSVVRVGADIHVWVNDGPTVYPSYDDVVISVHASRSCYAAVFVIDTYGFIHLIHPFSPYESAWVRGGRTYRFNGRDLGLDMLGGRGIAHVFAFSSPRPFDFAPYGKAIFVGGYGYRIYGDPYMACRQLYVTLVPTGYVWAEARIGFARFYVREWVRYPTYLCYGYHGGTVHVRVGDSCRQCYQIYDEYRVHVNDPYVAFRETPARYKDKVAGSGDGRLVPTQIKKTDGVTKRKLAAERDRSTAARTTANRTTARSAKIVSAKRTEVRAGSTKTPARSTTTRVTKAKRQQAVVATRTSKTTGAKTRVGTTQKAKSSDKSAKVVSKAKKERQKGQVRK
jgi:hypothetical protein